MVARSHETHTRAAENPELGISWTGKQTNCKTCLEIFMRVFIYSFSYAENLSTQKIGPNCTGKQVWLQQQNSFCFKLCLILGDGTLWLYSHLLAGPWPACCAAWGWCTAGGLSPSSLRPSESPPLRQARNAPLRWGKQRVTYWATSLKCL